MTIRLQGTWENDQHQFVFEPRTGGIAGKPAGPGLLFRKIDRASGQELARGTLTPDLDDGLLRGQVREGLSSPLGHSLGEREMTAWVDDRGRLWMNNYNATPDGKLYIRAPTQPDEAAAAAWVGKWRTNHGVLEVTAEGGNFAAYILAEDGSRRERVAFKADAMQATGAWDSEFDAQGVWKHKPVRWGDLGLTRSAGGDSFTGWYSAPRAVMGLERREWTGQRISGGGSPQTPQRPPAGPDARAEQLKGRWFTPFGPVEMREEVVGNRVQVGGQFTDAKGVSHHLFYVLHGPGLLQILTGITNQPAPIMIADDGLSFEVDGTGPGVNGRWRATRTDPYATRAQPTAEQATLLRVLEGRWRERDGDSLWRFPIAGQDGVADAVTWRAAEAEGAGTPASFAPVQDGRRLIARVANGERLLIERNTLGEIHLVRPAQGDAPASSVELIKLRNAPSGPAQPPPPSAPAPSQPAPPSAPTPSQPGGPPPASSPPSTGAGQPAPVPAGFRPLNRVDVRVDRVAVARGYPTHQVHVFVTVKNSSATPQYFTSGFVKVVLSDADGAGWERSQPYRASGEPAALFSATPVIQPGGELKVRYVFMPDPGARLSSLVLSEGGRQAAFPVGGL
jgi:hypothetical protein